MIEAVIGALEIGTQIYGLAQQLPQDISTWTLNRDQIPMKLSSLQDKLGFISQQLDIFSRAMSSAAAVTANEFQHSNINLHINNCKCDIQKISGIITSLDRRMRRRRYFPLPLRPIEIVLQSVESDQKELQGSINELSNTIETISDNTIKTPVWAPRVSKYYYINLESENPVKKVMDYILRADVEPIGAIIIGGGGVGKTTAVCQLARNIRIRARFTDGVLFTELGKEATKAGVIDKIAYLVKLNGRKDLQQKIQQLDSIEEAATEAALVFQDKHCLIIFDDVWREPFKYPDIISALSRLSTSEGCKVVFTTRDGMYLTDDLTSDVSVLLDKRSTEESERILLQSAGLEKPEVTEDMFILTKILREADGLPLTLGLAGKALRQLTSSDNNISDMSIWFRYVIRSSRRQRPKAPNSNVPESVQDRLIVSIELIQEQTKNTKYWEYFRALSVVQKAERMPYRVLCRAFGESHSTAATIIEIFEKYNIVTIEGDAEDYANRFIVIHDFVLDFARELTDENGESLAIVTRWLSSFRSPNRRDERAQSSSIAGTFNQWWSHVDNDADNYIYRHVFRILKSAGMHDEALWLINEPSWIQKQLKANGLHQIRSDLDLLVQCVQAWDGLQLNQREVMNKWLKLLRAAITASYDAVSKSDWDGMVFTQLYGRLESYQQSSGVVQDFLRKVKECAPRPFLLPGAGSFPPVPSSFQEKIKFDGQLLVMRQINDCVHIVSCVDLEDASDGLKNSLVLQVNDLRNKSVDKEEILRTKFSFKYLREYLDNCYGTMNINGTEIVIGTEDGYILILETGNGNASNPHDSIRMAAGGKWKTTVLHGHEAYVGSVAMSADGTRIVSGSDDKTVRMWGTHNGQWTSTALQGHEDYVRSVTMSGDGTRIVSGSDDNAMCVWDTHNDKWTPTVLRGHEEWLLSVGMSADGMRIVSGSRDKTVRVWDTHNGQWTSTVLRGHENWVMLVAMSADGTRFISGSDDSTVRVWDTHNGQWTSTELRGHEHCVSSVAMSADGARIVSGSDDKTVRVWDTHNDEWRQSAVLDVSQDVESMKISESGDIIEAINVWGDKKVRWILSNGSWEECGEEEGIVLGASSPIVASSLHSQLKPAHRQALQVLQNDLNMRNSAYTADGFVVYGSFVAPFIGFIHIWA